MKNRPPQFLPAWILLILFTFLFSLLSITCHEAFAQPTNCTAGPPYSCGGSTINCSTSCPDTINPEAWVRCPANFWLQGTGFSYDGSNIRRSYAQCWNPTTNLRYSSGNGMTCRYRASVISCPDWTADGGPEASAICPDGYVLKGFGLTASGGNLTQAHSFCWNPSTNSTINNIGSPQAYVQCVNATESLDYIAFSSSNNNQVRRSEAECTGPVPPCNNNGVCDSGETCALCPTGDNCCSACNNNGVCDPGETCALCPVGDNCCPPCNNNGVCDPGETCALCPVGDNCCPVCNNNGVCDPGETCALCPVGDNCCTCTSPAIGAISLAAAGGIISVNNFNQFIAPIDTLRADAGLGAFNWAGCGLPVAPGGIIRTAHLNCLWQAIIDVYNTCPPAGDTPAWTPVNAGDIISANYLNLLRTAVQNAK